MKLCTNRSIHLYLFSCWILFIDISIFNFLYFVIILGRVHSAMVSKVNLASRSVTVEWYERGETKGKEVEMDMLQQLNPELFNNSEQPQIIQQQQQPPQPTNLQRVSQFNSIIFCSSKNLLFMHLPTRSISQCSKQYKHLI